MTNYNYCCLNGECEEKNVKIQKPEEFEEMVENCEVCDKPLKLMGHSTFTIASSKGRTRQNLIKRSKEHYKTQIADTQRSMIKSATPNVR